MRTDRIENNNIKRTHTYKNLYYNIEGNILS